MSAAEPPRLSRLSFNGKCTQLQSPGNRGYCALEWSLCSRQSVCDFCERCLGHVRHGSFSAGGFKSLRRLAASLKRTVSCRHRHRGFAWLGQWFSHPFVVLDSGYPHVYIIQLILTDKPSQGRTEPLVQLDSKMEPGPRILAPKHGHSKTFVVAFWMGPVGPVDFHGMRHACQEQKVPRFQGAMG